MKRLVRWLKQRIPLNAATIGFIILEAATLSAFLAPVLTTIRPFEISEIVSYACTYTATAAWGLLTFWCWFFVSKSHAGLAETGLLTFIFGIILGLLTPAL
jgi:hypothetical protein